MFDENLSPVLPRRIVDLFPGSVHVRDVGMKATDTRRFGFLQKRATL
ncbi:MAG: hypothetical protein KIS76_11350 [Pyrinomonadaceae bacterium]|nr:hypothetical protein [Pyrinomonadaceae bacterium]